MKAKKSPSKVMVKAPSGYHWMTERGRYYLMPHEGDFKPHTNAALEMPFKIKKAH